ncbi:MAG TPA: hypothetical protein VGH38_25520 [Bryobacteraceae bacterium]|jgi:hypothetical protein
MKKSFLIIALAVASVPMIFAKSQVPPPASSATATSKPAVTATTRKHSRKATKKVTPKTGSTTAAKPMAATPAAAAKPAGK